MLAVSSIPAPAEPRRRGASAWNALSGRREGIGAGPPRVDQQRSGRPPGQAPPLEADRPVVRGSAATRTRSDASLIRSAISWPTQTALRAVN